MQNTIPRDLIIPAGSNPFSYLPNEVHAEIFSHLDAHKLRKIAFVCKTWHRISSDMRKPPIPKEIFLKIFSYLDNPFTTARAVCFTWAQVTTDNVVYANIFNEIFHHVDFYEQTRMTEALESATGERPYATLLRQLFQKKVQLFKQTIPKFRPDQRILRLSSIYAFKNRSLLQVAKEQLHERNSFSEIFTHTSPPYPPHERTNPQNADNFISYIESHLTQLKHLTSLNLSNKYDAG